MVRGKGRSGTRHQGRQNGDAQVRNNQMPSNQPNRGNHQNNPGEMPQSRRPINGIGKEVGVSLHSTADDENSDTNVAENVEKKHMGRPGEKKFNGRCRLFVANLHNTITEDELKAEFGKYGETGEVYVNKEKGFGFVRLDYRHNAEMAKLSLDQKLLKGRNISVRYATNGSAIELHGLDGYASNEYLGRAMSSFGPVERCVVVCDDRGRSKGYAIVEFEWKRSATKVLDRLKDEMFVLGRLPKPVFAKPYVIQDEEEGVMEESLEQLEGFQQERSNQPRFISPSSFEYVWAKRWRDLFIEEQEKKAKLEKEMTDARCKLEFEMEAALRQHEASRIREELAQRQEELSRLSEEMIKRQEADMQILERSRQREMAARSGNPETSPECEQELHQNEMQLSRENAACHHDFMQLRQRAENILQTPFTNSQGPFGRGYPMRQHQGMPQHLMSAGYGGGYSQQGGQCGARPPHIRGMDFRANQQHPQKKGQKTKNKHAEDQVDGSIPVDPGPKR